MMQEFDFSLPGLGKPKSSRPERAAAAVFEELSVLLRQTVRDRRLHGVTISQVWMSPDLKVAKIWFVVPKDGNAAEARKGMERACGFFRSHLAKTLNMRHTPELIFYCDSSSEEAERIEQLFVRISQERAAAEQQHDE